MTVDGSGSPIQIILARARAPKLTADQRRRLELLDIDFLTEFTRLSCERQLLELGVRRAKADLPRGSVLTAKSLAAIDAIAVQIREVWRSADERARAILSPAQLAKLPTDISVLPGFESDFPTPSSGRLDELVADAVAARVKDAKVIEVETTQAIAERLFSWVKSAAIVTGIPLALLAVVLGLLGINNWTDFNKRIADGKNEVDQRLAIARKSASDFDAQATALRAQFADLQTRYGDVSSLASNVSKLTGQVERLEQITFAKSAALTPETQSEVKNRIEQYRSYLQSIGYNPPARELKVEIQPDVGNAFYDGQSMIVDERLVTAPETFYGEYTFSVLKETNQHFWTSNSWKFLSIGYGLHDYFSCSYQGDPVVGAKIVEVFRDRYPDEIRKRGYLHNLTNKRSFSTDSSGAEEQEGHKAGEAWSGVFWDVRTILGCKGDTAKCETTDRILLASWKALSDDPAATVDVRFAQDIVRNISQSVGSDQANKVRDAFAQRGLVLPQ